MPTNTVTMTTETTAPWPPQRIHAREINSAHPTKPIVNGTQPVVNGSGVSALSGIVETDAHEIDYARPMKVVVVGAGISGILAAIRFPRRVPNLELVLYDKNPEIGGTWYENRYPGVACGMSNILRAYSELTAARIYPCSCLPSVFRAQPQLVRVLCFWR